MRRVVLESPYRGLPSDDQHETVLNILYAEKCLLDCLNRNEAALASHLLYTRVLNDDWHNHRALGIHAGHRWIDVADALVVYTDRGISEGMKAGIRAAELRKIRVEYRTLNGAKGHG